MDDLPPAALTASMPAELAERLTMPDIGTLWVLDTLKAHAARLDNALALLVRIDRQLDRIENLVVLSGGDEGDKAKAKALLAETLPRTEALKAALASFPTVPPTPP